MSDGTPDRYFTTRDPGLLLAYRAFRDGQENKLWRALSEAKESLERARVDHDRAQGRLAAAQRDEIETRDWFAREVLRASGQTEPDRSFEVGFAYMSGGGLVVCVRRKAAT